MKTWIDLIKPFVKGVLSMGQTNPQRINTTRRPVTTKSQPVKKDTKITTTKKLMAYIIVNCTIVELYTMFIVYKFQEASILEPLISAVVAESFSFFVYCMKSYFETKAEKANELSYYRINKRYQDEQDSQDNINDDS
jgi:hypothetical protein